jgi:predicted ATP-grasp superfamily ATP-dependent carboligase
VTEAGSALVVEGVDDRAALAACRALAAAGWRVGAGSPPRGLAAASRVLSARHRVTPPQEDLDRFAADVAAAVREGAYEVVFSGGGDAEAMALSLVRDRIEAAIPYGPHESFVRALDKYELARAARTAGIAAPAATEATEDALAAHRGTFVVKARLHAPRLGGSGPSRLPTAVTTDRAVASEAASRIREAGGEPLLQEPVMGALTAFSCVAGPDGEILARSQQRAERVWPVAAGVSARAVTVPVDPELEAGASRLLAELGWTGAAELQFLDPVEGPPQLIDFNGRFYGSLALAVSAGANLPAAWAAAATGRPLPADRTARPGCVYQWLESDLRRAVSERRGGLLDDLAGTLRTALPPTAHSITSRRDPRPLGRALGSLALRGLTRLRPARG